jgi:hypothetical protein
MNEDNNKDDIDAEIDKIFQAESRSYDPAARLSGDRLKAQIRNKRVSFATVRKILADDTKISILIEKTRQDIDAAGQKRRAKSTKLRVEDNILAHAAIPLLLSNSEKTLADIERMHSQLISLLGAVQDEQTKMATAAADLTQTSAQIVAHTAEMKAVSDQTKIDVPKILAEATAANGKLELWPTLRTAIITASVLTPFTLGTSILGNKLTTWLETGHWSPPPAAASPPPQPPPTVNLDNRQYWIVLPSQESSAVPRDFDRPFIIPQKATPHPRPHRTVTHTKVRAHTKAPR